MAPRRALIIHHSPADKVHLRADSLKLCEILDEAEKISPGMCNVITQILNEYTEETGNA